MTTSSPATTRLDLPVDLHTFTDDLVWGYLDDARDPDQIVEGAELWVGTRRHAVRARVGQRTDEPFRDRRHPALTRLTPAPPAAQLKGAEPSRTSTTMLPQLPDPGHE